MRRFEYIAGGSAKFWEAGVEGRRFFVVFGRLGTTGRRMEWELPTEEAARRQMERKINEKLREGYHEATGGMPAVPPPDRAAAAPLALRPAAALAAQPPSSGPFSDLRCANATCARHKEGGEGALRIVSPPGEDYQLRCDNCRREFPWKKALSEHLNLDGATIAGIFFLFVLVGLQFLRLGLGWRLLLSSVPLAFVGAFAGDFLKYRTRVKEIEAEKSRPQALPGRAMPPAWQEGRAALDSDLGAFPLAQQTLADDLRSLDVQMANAQARLEQISSMASDTAEDRLRDQLRERKNQIEAAASERARELHQEALKLLEERLSELPRLREKQEELVAAIETASISLENLRLRLDTLRDYLGPQLEDEVKLMALDLKARLADIEAILK
jgi:predicted DNA-binding WGR domain protein